MKADTSQDLQWASRKPRRPDGVVQSGCCQGGIQEETFQFGSKARKKKQSLISKGVRQIENSLSVFLFYSGL